MRSKVGIHRSGTHHLKDRKKTESLRTHRSGTHRPRDRKYKGPIVQERQFEDISVRDTSSWHQRYLMLESFLFFTFSIAALSPMPICFYLSLDREVLCTTFHISSFVVWFCVYNRVFFLLFPRPHPIRLHNGLGSVWCILVYRAYTLNRYKIYRIEYTVHLIFLIHRTYYSVTSFLRSGFVY